MTEQTADEQKNLVVPPVLLNAQKEALAALYEIAPKKQVGKFLRAQAVTAEVAHLLFESKHPGYPHWTWCATVATVDDKNVTILEVEMIPDADALLAPEWTPWEERLADYRQELAEEEAKLATEKEEARLAADEAKEQREAARAARNRKNVEDKRSADDRMSEDADHAGDSGDGDDATNSTSEEANRSDDEDRDQDHDEDHDEDILETHFDHELRGELPLQLDEIVDDLELEDPNEIHDRS